MRSFGQYPNLPILALIFSTAYSTSSANACSPPPVDPPLQGESVETYKARLEAEDKAKLAHFLADRQTVNLKRADSIFIARETARAPRRPAEARNGRSLPPRSVPTEYPYPIYFKPVKWFRGTSTGALFRVTLGITTCGPWGVGDASSSRLGQHLLFFGRKGLLTEKVLIDAIAVDKINDPALTAFVTRYRADQP